MIRTNRLYQTPCVLFVFILTLFVSPLQASNAPRVDNINQFESTLDQFESRLMDAEVAWQSVVAEVKTYNRFSTVSTRLNQLRNEINGLSAYVFPMRVLANKLNSRTLIMGVRDLNNDQRSALQGAIDALDAHNAGFFTTQFLVPIEADIDDMFRTINDCLRREIQVIRRNL